MKKRNGFTLIELLAIIVILAIIAVITIPVILNIIDNSKKGAARDSAYGYKDSINKYYYNNLVDNDRFDFDGRYSIDENGFLSGLDSSGNQVVHNIAFSGKVPDGGFVSIFNNDVITGCLQFGEYAVQIRNGEIQLPIVAQCDDLNPVIAILDGEKGNLQAGDIVRIGDTEKFYVISSDNSENGKTLLLAKYHLNVDWYDVDPDSTAGIQSTKYLNDNYGNDYSYGKIGTFSETSDGYANPYWKNNVGLDNSFKYYGKVSSPGVYEDPYPYVYDENSTLYSYVENYKKDLIRMGAPSNITARLLSYDEAMSLGCSQSVDSTIQCSGFVGREHYWLGSAIDENYVYVIYDNEVGYLNPRSQEYTNVGIRPVIEVPTSSINEGLRSDVYSKPCGNNCKYAYYTESKALKNNLEDFPEAYSVLSSDIKVYREYEDVGRNVFLGHVLDNNGKIDRAFVCGVKNNVSFCLEGKVDGSSYESNMSVLDGLFSGIESYEEYSQVEDDHFLITLYPTGGVSIEYDYSFSCSIEGNGLISCQGS